MPTPQSMEQSTLHTMLHDRDAQISSLLHQLHSLSDNISTLQKELHHKSQSRKHQREEHTAAIQKLKEEHAEQRAHLARYEGKIKSGGGLRVHEYASLMKAANKDVESSYVIRLQAQLCRAMHSLGVMESQLALVKENCSSLIKCMKEDLSHMVDDRTRREIELMNTLAMVDAEKRAWQCEMEKKLREQEDLLDSVRDEYEELGLEYDEEEVRNALEVQMLQESVERVRSDKLLAEKELLAALLDREEQIGILRGELEGLDDRVKVLRGESGGENAKASGESSSDVAADKAGEKKAETSIEATIEDNKEDGETEVETSAETKKLSTAEVEEQTPSTEKPAEHYDETTPAEQFNHTASNQDEENNANTESSAEASISELTSKLNDTTIEQAEESEGECINVQNEIDIETEQELQTNNNSVSSEDDTPEDQNASSAAVEIKMESESEHISKEDDNEVNENLQPSAVDDVVIDQEASDCDTNIDEENNNEDKAVEKVVDVSEEKVTENLKAVESDGDVVIESENNEKDEAVEKVEPSSSTDIPTESSTDTNGVVKKASKEAQAVHLDEAEKTDKVDDDAKKVNDVSEDQ